MRQEYLAHRPRLLGPSVEFTGALWSPVQPTAIPHGAPVRDEGDLFHGALAPALAAALSVSHGERRMRGRNHFHASFNAEG